MYFCRHWSYEKNERIEVEKVFREQFDINLICVDAGDRFLGKLKGVTDPERKRKIIGEEFIRVFEEEAKKLELWTSWYKERFIRTLLKAAAKYSCYQKSSQCRRTSGCY